MEPSPTPERSGSRKLLRYAPFIGIVLVVVLIWVAFGRGDGDGSSSDTGSGGGNGPVVFSADNKDSVDWGPQCDTTRGTVAVPLVATSRKRGVLTKIVGGVGDEWSGWILGVKTASPVKAVKELDGKKVGITSAGSGTDTLALWAQSEHKITYQRVGVGGGGLVPNLLNDNLAAAVIYSPLSYQVVSEGKVRVLVDFATAMPPNLIGGWTATEKNLTERRAFIQKGLNALYGALAYMRANPDYAIKTIAANNELPMEIAKMEYEKTFLRLSRDGQMTPASVQKAMDLAAASGVKDMAPAAEVFVNMPIAPTKP